MSELVVDASAVIAVLRGEPGDEYVQQEALGAAISSVNVAEIFSFALARSDGRELVEALIRTMQLREFAFDHTQADVLASIYTQTLGSSVGFADRACLALAKSQGVPVLTGDHDWLKHDIGVDVRLFRQTAKA